VLIIPHDVQELDAVPTPPHKHGIVHSGLGVAKPEVVPAQSDLPDFPYARFAETLGLVGVRVERPDQIGSAWDKILSADRPGVFEAYVDPNVAPLPPHISLEQAKNFLASILKGDAEALGFLKQIGKDVAVGYIPGRK
jgi:pyruvate dehydrogenase (quinone)